MKWAYSEPATAEKKAPTTNASSRGSMHPDPDRLGGQPVVALGEHVAPVRGALDAPHDVDDEQRPAPSPPQVRVGRDVRERPRAAGERVGVEEHDPDDDQEAERRDGDEVARQPHQHPADEPGDAAHDDAPR